MVIGRWKANLSLFLSALQNKFINAQRSYVSHLYHKRVIEQLRIRDI